VTLLKYGNGGYLAWRFHFWGRKISSTLLNVYLIASRLVEKSELQLTNSSCPIATDSGGANNLFSIAQRFFHDEVCVN
jgi:hypothetical protein